MNTSKPVESVIRPSSFASRAALPLAVFAVALVALLFSEVRMMAWAEASELHHALQHIIIFLAGFGMGGAGLSMLHIRKQQ